MAEPSRRNSGQETTENGIGLGLSALDNICHPVAGPDRNGGLVDDDQRCGHVLGDGLRRGRHILQVRFAIHPGWRSDRDEGKFRTFKASA